MSINIKNEAVRLIRELVRLTGEGQTEAVMESVRERIARLDRVATSRALPPRLTAASYLEIGIVPDKGREPVLSRSLDGPASR